MRRYEDNHTEEKGVIQSVGWINAILGAWLIISPYILSYTSASAKWNQTILGIVVLILGIARITAPRQQWLSFLNGLAAVWLIIAPWALNYQRSAAYWNEVVVAIIVGVLAFWNSGLTTHTDRRHPAM